MKRTLPLLSFSLLLIASCSENPFQSQPDSVLYHSEDLDFIHATLQQKADGVMDASWQIPVDADQLTQFSNQWISIRIPAGSLSEDQIITASLVDEEGFGVSLLPHGLQFANNVQVEYSLDLVDDSALSDDVQVFYSRDDALYEAMETMLETDVSRIEFATDHFSKYILATLPPDDDADDN